MKLDWLSKHQICFKDFGIYIFVLSYILLASSTVNFKNIHNDSTVQSFWIDNLYKLHSVILRLIFKSWLFCVALLTDIYGQSTEYRNINKSSFFHPADDACIEHTVYSKLCPECVIPVIVIQTTFHYTSYLCERVTGEHIQCGSAKLTAFKKGAVLNQLSLRVRLFRNMD